MSTSIKKPYRVTLRSVVTVEVDVDATTEDEAWAKAFEWNGDYPRGISKIGSYWLEDELLFDGGDMSWEIQNIEDKDIVEVLELEEDDHNDNADEAGEEK